MIRVSILSAIALAALVATAIAVPQFTDANFSRWAIFPLFIYPYRGRGARRPHPVFGLAIGFLLSGLAFLLAWLFG